MEVFAVLVCEGHVAELYLVLEALYSLWVLGVYDVVLRHKNLIDTLH